MDNQIAKHGERQSNNLPAKTSASLKPICPLSVVQAFQSQQPSLAQINREAGGELALTAIESLITDVVRFLNVGKNMNVEQIKQTAELILSEYHYLNIDELRFIFRNAKLGRYGKQYDVLDGQVIFRWIETYDSERTNEVIKSQVDTKNALTSSFDFTPEQWPEERHKQWQQLINDFTKRKPIPDDFGQRNAVSTPQQQTESLQMRNQQMQEWIDNNECK